MAAIVVEGSARMPVRYETWAAWRRAAVADRPPLIAADTRSCGLCWGAGRIQEQARNGEGLIGVPCEVCGGSGLVSSLLG